LSVLQISSTVLSSNYLPNHLEIACLTSYRFSSTFPSEEKAHLKFLCSYSGFGIYDRAQVLVQHPESGTILDELREGGWRKLLFRRWKIVYTIRRDAVIMGRVWPAAMGEADFKTPL
jgi:hypothetical protein